MLFIAFLWIWHQHNYLSDNLFFIKKLNSVIIFIEYSYKYD